MLYVYRLYFNLIFFCFHILMLLFKFLDLLNFNLFKHEPSLDSTWCFNCIVVPWQENNYAIKATNLNIP